jgi:hypothetical protein
MVVVRMLVGILIWLMIFSGGCTPSTAGASDRRGVVNVQRGMSIPLKFRVPAISLRRVK